MSDLNPPPHGNPPQPALRREVGIFGATMMGLGSIVGTGIFVSLGNAAGSAGSTVILAIALAALVAACNGLSSAQLAAAHPVSGGTYEYGYRWLHPVLGFTAGWMFLCAKSASAATAALGLAGYTLNSLGWNATASQVPLALVAVLVITVLVSCGIRASSAVNIGIVSLTLIALIVFVLAGFPTAFRQGTTHLSLVVPQTAPAWGRFLEACALMFVAYTGYGRIATLGEEIHNPRRNIPVAMILTLVVSMLLYVSVGTVALAAVGPETLAQATRQQAAPLEVVARQFDFPAAGQIIAVGAVTAMLGVLLNLVLGLSRVVLAMSRRGDLPPLFGKLNRQQTTPFAAVIGVGLVTGGLVLLGNVKTTWSFSAFTVLIYYALTNLAALRLPATERLYPLVISWLGLLSCLFLAFWVERAIWLSGLGMILIGLIWRYFARRFAPA